MDPQHIYPRRCIISSNWWLFLELHHDTMILLTAVGGHQSGIWAVEGEDGDKQSFRRAGRCCCEPFKARLTNFTITIVVSKHIMKHSLFKPTRMLTQFYSVCLSGNGPSPPPWIGKQFWRKCLSRFSGIDLWFSCHVCGTASRLQLSASMPVHSHACTSLVTK